MATDDKTTGETRMSRVDIDTGTEQLLCHVEEGVAVITLNRPEARNALSDHLTPALRRMIRERGEDASVGAMVITGAGRAFCSGGDVKGMGDRSARQAMPHDARVADLKMRQSLLTGALVACRKPTVAALPGAAAGAGLAIALACDLRIAAASAFVASGYVRVGLPGDYGIAWLLTRTVGPAKARELMFTGDKVDAALGERLGLFNRVVPDERLMDETLALARSLAAGPRIAMAAIKDNLDDATRVDFAVARDREAERMVRVQGTADHKEAVRAFVEKRKPNFTGS
jgi:enoyl-CoA hydratase/carnithine racemase